MDKKYYFVIGFLMILVVGGGILVSRIPSTENIQSSQDVSQSATINSADANTLGAEVSPAPSTSSATNTNMNDKLIIQD